MEPRDLQWARVGVRRVDERELERRDSLGLVPELDVRESAKAAEKEAAADEKDERKRDLDRDEEAPQAVLPALTGSSGAERQARVGTREVEGRDEPDADPGEERGGHEEGEHSPIDSDLGEPGDVAGREPGEDGNGPLREERSREGKKNAFDHQLPQKPRATRSEGSPYQDLMLEARGANQEQVRHVGAGDEEDEPDGRPEDDERGADRCGQRLMKGLEMKIQAEAV